MASQCFARSSTTEPREQLLARLRARAEKLEALTLFAVLWLSLPALWAIRQGLVVSAW